MDIFVSAISQRPFHLYGIEYVYLLADPVLEARLTPADRRYFFLIPAKFKTRSVTIRRWCTPSQADKCET